jgi:capsular exopolysaccharide synthesis family protein
MKNPRGKVAPFANTAAVRNGKPEEPASALPIDAQFLLVTLRRWWLVVLPCGLLLAAVAGLGLHYMLPLSYQAVAWLKVSESTPFIAFQPHEADRRFLETQMELLHSPLILEPVISQPEISKIPEIRTSDSPSITLGNMIKASSVGQSELVKVSFSAANPSDAARVVNAVVDAFIDFRGRNDAEQTQRVLELLDEERGRRIREVDTMRENIHELTKQITNKDVFASTSKTPNEPRIHSPLADIQTKLVSIEVDRQILEARIQAFEESVNKGNIEVPELVLDRAVNEHPNIQTLKQAMMQKQSRLQDYESKLKLGQEESRYKLLNNEISEDEKRLQEASKELRETIRRDIAEKMAFERKDELAKMHNSLESLQLTERLLQERDANLRKTAQEASSDTLKLEFKQEELNRAEKVLEMIAERALKLRTEQRAPARVALMKKADEKNATTEWKPHFKKVLTGTLFCFFFPLPWVIGWEWLTRRVNNAKQLEQFTRLPVVGEIVRLPARSLLSSQSLSRRAQRNLALFDESIDSLRTNIMLSETRQAIQVLAVTSASNSEGKTSIALQLALSISRAANQKVLLIDGDMRSPDIHRLLNTRLEPGLSDVLSRRCSAQECIITDWSELVHILPAGVLQSNPHNLLGNDTWSTLIAEMKPLYPYIVVDTPPVLPASESLVLSRSADVCLVCAMRDVSHLDRIQHCCKRLSAAGIHPEGVVLNGIPIQQYARHYGKYYGVPRQSVASV